MAGVARLPKILASLGKGLDQKSQDLSIGSVYRRKDFNSRAVRDMWHHFDTGMMEEYIANLNARQRRFPIIEGHENA